MRIHQSQAWKSKEENGQDPLWICQTLVGNRKKRITEFISSRKRNPNPTTDRKRKGMEKRLPTWDLAIPAVLPVAFMVGCVTVWTPEIPPTPFYR